MSDGWLQFAKPLLWAAVAYGAFRLVYWAFVTSRRRRVEVRDRVVLVTGASSGLGKAMARRFHLAGAKLILAARSIEKLEQLCQELKTENPANKNEPVYRYLDLAEPNGIAELAALAPDGKIDVLVNNAGISVRGSCEETTLETHRQLMEVNYFGQIAITQGLLPLMSERPSIVVVGSVQGKIAIPFRSAYGASKHAIQVAKQKGYVKFNGKKFSDDVEKIKRRLEKEFTSADTLPTESQMVSFVKDNVYLVGGFAAGFLIGLGTS